MIPVEKIGALIGPGGKTIRRIQEETGVNIDTQDDGTVLIASSDEAMIRKARERIEGLTREAAVGDIFTGKVARITSFGAFVELIPGKDGLLRTEEVGEMEGALEMGQELTVIVKEIDHLGRINLSRRDLLGGSEEPREPASRMPGPRPGGSPMAPGDPCSGRTAAHRGRVPAGADRGGRGQGQGRRPNPPSEGLRARKPSSSPVPWATQSP